MKSLTVVELDDFEDDGEDGRKYPSSASLKEAKRGDSSSPALAPTVVATPHNKSANFKSISSEETSPKDSESLQKFRRLQDLLTYNRFTLRFHNEFVHNQYIEASQKYYSSSSAFILLVVVKFLWSILYGSKLFSAFKGDRIPEVIFAVNLVLLSLAFFAALAYWRILHNWLKSMGSIVLEGSRSLLPVEDGPTSFSHSEEDGPTTSSHSEMSADDNILETSSRLAVGSKELDRIRLYATLTNVFGILQMAAYSVTRSIEGSCEIGCLDGLAMVYIARLWIMPLYTCTYTSSGWLDYLFYEISAKIVLIYLLAQNGSLTGKRGLTFGAVYIFFVVAYQLSIYHLYVLHISRFRQRKLLVAMIPNRDREIIPEYIP